MGKEDHIWKNRGALQKLVLLIAITATVYHVWFAMTGAPEPFWFRTIHLTFLLPLVFLVYPLKNKKFIWIDLILCVSSFLSLFYLWGWEYERILSRFVKMDPIFRLDVFMGLILLATLLEGTRRILGWPLTILTILSLVYLLVGDKVPTAIRTSSFSLERIVEQLYLTTNGIFGIPIGASASFIFLFIFFGALLQRSNTGQMFIDLAKSMVGHMKGGPAKIAVLSSALMGTLSGSPTANVVTTGVFTIPLMEKNGYSKNYSAAVEATASTGGQIMPPVMGAVAFVLADFVGVPYIGVVKAALFPAILFFLTVLLMVHLQAGKQNIGGIDRSELPNWVSLLKYNWHLFIPIILLVYILVAGYTAYFAATVAILSTPIVSFLRKHTRMEIRQILLAMEDGVKASILVAIATASAGIIIGSLNMSGLAVKISNMILAQSSSILLLTLLLTMLITVILGMGMPTTAAYITAAAITAPILVSLGIDVFSAHMFVLYFACLSSITPPVAIAAYAAAGINASNPLKVALLSCRIGIIAFIVPFIFVFSDVLFLQGDILSVVIGIVTAIYGVTLIAIGFEGYLFGTIEKALTRLVITTLGLIALYPHVLLSGIAVLISLLIIIKMFLTKKKEGVETNI